MALNSIHEMRRSLQKRLGMTDDDIAKDELIRALSAPPPPRLAEDILDHIRKHRDEVNKLNEELRKGKQ